LLKAGVGITTKGPRRLCRGARGGNTPDLLGSLFIMARADGDGKTKSVRGPR
jgi:hypothetical protein